MWSGREWWCWRFQQQQQGRGGVIRLTKAALCLGRALRSQAVWDKQAAARLCTQCTLSTELERGGQSAGAGSNILTHTDTHTGCYTLHSLPILWNKSSFPTTGWQVSPGDSYLTSGTHLHLYYTYSTHTHYMHWDLPETGSFMHWYLLYCPY